MVLFSIFSLPFRTTVASPTLQKSSLAFPFPKTLIALRVFVLNPTASNSFSDHIVWQLLFSESDPSWRNPWGLGPYSALFSMAWRKNICWLNEGIDIILNEKIWDSFPSRVIFKFLFCSNLLKETVLETCHQIYGLLGNDIVTLCLSIFIL